MKIANKDNKDKAVFFCRDKVSVNRIFESNEEIMKKFNAELEFPVVSDDSSKMAIVDLDNIEQFKDFTNECKYIFSVWGMPQLSESDIKKYFGKCEVIFYGAGSVQYFARDYLNSGIKITSAWIVNGIPVAEYTVSQIILSCKGFYKILGKVKKPEDWWGMNRSTGEKYKGNYNTKIGILGAGAVGKKVISNLKNLAVMTDILVYDPYLSEKDAEIMNVRKASLEEIFKTCDVISNHVANLPSTVGMLNKTHFDLMRDYTTFINTGRGAQIVESDMTDALKNNKTLTAILDVTEPEPPEINSELYNLENVILTPHVAGVNGNELCHLSDCMYHEYKLYENEKKLKYEVTLDMLEYLA